MKLIVGAGLIGKELARHLIELGEEVVVATRSGTPIDGAKAIKVNAKDPEELAIAARGATTIFLCTNPPYHMWKTEWPPVFEAAIHAAEKNRADVVVMGNLYPYGRATAPMTEESPEVTKESKGMVRRAGWQKMRSASIAGKFRAVEVRASDYFGPGAGSTAHIGEDFFLPILNSKTAMVIGNPNAEHSWSFIPDIAKTLVAASRFEGEWGRVWHVPSGKPKSRNEILKDINNLANSKGKLFVVPQPLLKFMGFFSPLYREVYASSYQFTKDFVIDSTETEAILQVKATPWKTALEQTLASYSNR